MRNKDRLDIAKAALQGLLSNSYTGDAALHDTPEEWVKDMVETSVEMADALLKELSK